MYGYVTVNKAELKFREYDLYHSFIVVCVEN